MKKIFISLISSLLLAGLPVLAQPVMTGQVEEDNMTEPVAQAKEKANTAIWLELLGPAGLAGVFFGHQFNDLVGINVGAGYFSASASATATSGSTTVTSTSKVNVFLIPVFASFLIGDGPHHLELDAGIDVAVVDGSASSFGVESSGSGVGFAGLAGVGYRYQPHAGGFFFRATGYLLVGSSVAPWVGASFGYTF